MGTPGHTGGTSVLRVDVLGPLRLSVGGRPVDVPGQRRRAVLALLALASGRALSVDALIDALWRDDPPESGTAALHSHLSRLRGHLGPAGDRLRRSGAGYVLHLEDDELDAAVARRMAQIVSAQLASDPGQAAETARTALALWRGDALGEFAEVEPLAADAVGLAELHRQLRDDALQARLELGDPSVAADAASAAAVEPLHERSAVLLVRALAAEGRTAEAMAVAAAYRRRLADETGLDPGPALAILEHEVAAGTLAPKPPVAAATRAVVRPSAPMVGRDRDRHELHRLLDSNAFVTVTGPGGVGKTRLSLDVAADLAERGDGEVVLVMLASVNDPARVPDAVASAVGLRINGGISAATVAKSLAGHSLLLVLDNCEHVAAACRELITAIQLEAPQVRVLSTSRLTLHVSGEFVMRLQPLPIPRDTTDLEALSRQPSVLAFMEHARRRGRAFTLTEDDAGAVVEVISRLDGLPLAIELAAGQLAVLPVAALRDRLARALDAFSADRPEDDARQRTLRATIGWSYGLLTPAERLLLRTLAPFPAGLDLGTIEMLAAEAIVGVDPVVVLSRLVDASLVTAAQSTGRYSLFETVRSFLLDDLAAQGERAEAERRFLAWAKETAQAIGAALASADEAVADGRLRTELPNLRAARDLAAVVGDYDLRVDITLALDEPAIWRDIQELWSWSLDLVEDTAALAHPRRVEVFGSAAEAAWLLGDLDRSRLLAGRGLDLARSQEPDDAKPQRCWSALAAVELFRGEPAAARTAWLRAAATDPRPAAHLAGAALAAGYGKDLTGADTILAQARDALARAPCPSHRAFINYVTGEVSRNVDPDGALAAYVAAVEEARGCGAGFIEGVASVGLASLQAESGNLAAAAGGFRFLLGYWQRTGNQTQLWTTARNAAWLLLDQRRYDAAALLLTAADVAGSAALLDVEAATRRQTAYSSLEHALGTAALDAIRRAADTVPSSRVVEVATRELSTIVTDAPMPTPESD